MARRLTAWAVAIILVWLGAGVLEAGAVEDGPPGTTLTVTVAGGAVSLEAVDAPLDEVLTRLGDALHTRIVIENVLRDDLSRTRVTQTFHDAPAVSVLRRLLRDRKYVLVEGPAGVDEVRLFVDGRSGYREITTPTTVPVGEWPPDDPGEVARLRAAALTAPDSSARREALQELAGIGDTALLKSTLLQALAHERDSRVLETVLDVIAQLDGGLPAEALRAFVTSDRDGSARALAVDQLATQAGDDAATRAVLQTLAANDASPEVREAAKNALENLDAPAAAPPRIPAAGR